MFQTGLNFFDGIISTSVLVFLVLVMNMIVEDLSPRMLHATKYHPHLYSHLFDTVSKI